MSLPLDVIHLAHLPVLCPDVVTSPVFFCRQSVINPVCLLLITWTWPFIVLAGCLCGFIQWICPDYMNSSWWYCLVKCIYVFALSFSSCSFLLFDCFLQSGVSIHLFSPSTDTWHCVVKLKSWSCIVDMANLIKSLAFVLYFILSHIFLQWWQDHHCRKICDI